MSKGLGIPKGTRDFSPKEMVRRNYIFDTIKRVFQTYGYMPIETPSMENMETLTGKYGDEGDRLIFKILKRGEKFENLLKWIKQNDSTIEITDLDKSIRSNFFSDEALRYDLTVPFARYVVQHQNDITFPFKRYQIQPVWRADRPQRGRYREFYQCDADVVGSDALIHEVELIQIFDKVLTQLQIPSFTIKLNNRKVLSGIAEVIGQPEQLINITVAIDKLDKIGKEKVLEELTERGVRADAIEKLSPLFDLSGTNEHKLSILKSFLADSEVGMKGTEELEYVLNYINLVGLESAELELDVTLARGLNYYTGAIFEVKANNVSIGSICGGGRYDDLTGIFGLKDVSGVGISFGADRIYDVLEELNLFPEIENQTTQILFLNFGEKEEQFVFKIASQLRNKGVNVEVYPDAAKLKKQMKYADNKNIPTTVIVGSEELANNTLSVKDMKTGEQEKVSVEQYIARF
jgi:histidyl-tRNA synthetase